jgi:uncharacterized protein
MPHTVVKFYAEELPVAQESRETRLNRCRAHDGTATAITRALNDAQRELKDSADRLDKWRVARQQCLQNDTVERVQRLGAEIAVLEIEHEQFKALVQSLAADLARR